MKKNIHFIFSLFLFIFLLSSYPKCAKAQVYGNDGHPNNSQGFEFFVVLPPNEAAVYNLENAFRYIYISAKEETYVEIYFDGSAQPVRSAFIAPYSVFQYPVPVSSEIRVSQQPTTLVYRIVSRTRPVSVYVINSKNATTEGYMAIPTRAWGTNYRHNCFWENYEGTQYGIPFYKTGFIVVASENKTNVQISLQGANGSKTGNTDAGTPMGQILKVTLNKGQAYRVAGKGVNNGTFDLSGTMISSDKPVGVVSYHERAKIPSNASGVYGNISRNHLSEMLFPTSSWGKEFYLVQFMKEASHGDYYRIMTYDVNNDYTIVWYDMLSGAQVGKTSGRLAAAGDFVEIPKFSSSFQTIFNNSIRGIGVIKTTKPAQVFQYCYTSLMQEFKLYDPFMTTVIPKEQYVYETIFQVPLDSLLTNKFNILAIGDTSDPVKNKELLSSIEISEQLDQSGIDKFRPLENYVGHSPFSFRIPNTNIYWGVLNMKPGAYAIRGKTKFGGTIYGTGLEDGYGWPAATSGANLKEKDTCKPLITHIEKCGDYEIHFTENRNGAENDNPRQVDYGVDIPPYFLPGAINYDIIFQAQNFPTYPAQIDYIFNVKVHDRRQDAYAILAIKDRAGNVGYDTLKYFAEKVEITPQAPLIFGNIKLGDTSYIDCVIKNTSGMKINVKKIDLRYKRSFALVQGVATELDTLVIPSGGTRNLRVAYSPLSDGAEDFDSILVVTACNAGYSFALRGVSVWPRINVGYFDAKTIRLGERVYSGNTLFLENSGSDVLKVSGYSLTNQNQYFKDSIYNVTLPITLAPKKRIMLQNVIFDPKTPGTYATNAIFHSNAISGDSVSEWTGRAVFNSPEVSDCDWKHRRIFSKNDSTIFVQNNSFDTLTIESIVFENGKTITDDGVFEMIGDYKDISLATWGTSFADDTASRVVIPVIYRPKAEFDNSAKVIVKFKNYPDSLIGVLHGYGFLPKIQFSGYRFPKPLNLKLNETAKAYNGEANIQSLSQSSDLHVKKLSLINGLGNSADFQVKYGNANLYSNPYSGVLKQKGAGESRLNLDLDFIPNGIANRFIALEIEHDAVPSNEYNDWKYKLDTMIISGAAIDPQIVNLSYDFGSILNCTQKVGAYYFENQSNFDTLEVYSPTITQNPEVFTIETPKATMTILPNSKDSVLIRFNPDAKPNLKNYTGEITANTMYRTSLIASEIRGEIKGATFDTPVELRLPVINEVVAGDKTIDSKSFTVSIKKLSDEVTWEKSNVYSVKFTLIYNAKCMSYDAASQIKPGANFAGWTFTGSEETKPDGMAYLTITGTGAKISADGIMCYPAFTFLLFDSSSFVVNIDDASFNTESCVGATYIPGKINYSACVQNLRNVKFTNTVYALEAIKPAPITNSVFDVNFSVGLNESATKIELIDATGATVKILHNGYLQSGDYKIAVQIGDVPSGVYYIKMVSGPFEQRERIVVSK